MVRTATQKQGRAKWTAQCWWKLARSLVICVSTHANRAPSHAQVCRTRNRDGKLRHETDPPLADLKRELSNQWLVGTFTRFCGPMKHLDLPVLSLEGSCHASLWTKSRGGARAGDSYGPIGKPLFRPNACTGR